MVCFPIGKIIDIIGYKMGFFVVLVFFYLENASTLDSKPNLLKLFRNTHLCCN